MTLWFRGQEGQPLLGVTGCGTPGQQGTGAGGQEVARAVGVHSAQSGQAVAGVC